jgi:hypothetical protein
VSGSRSSEFWLNCLLSPHYNDMIYAALPAEIEQRR